LPWSISKRRFYMRRKFAISIATLFAIAAVVFLGMSVSAAGTGYVTLDSIGFPGVNCAMGQIPWTNGGEWFCVDPYGYHFPRGSDVPSLCYEKTHKHGPVSSWYYNWTSTTTTAWCAEVFTNNNIITLVGSGECNLSGCAPICGYGWCADGLNPQEDQVHIWNQYSNEANFMRIYYTSGRPTPAP
jgi:hypothetical protein